MVRGVFVGGFMVLGSSEHCQNFWGVWDGWLVISCIRVNLVYFKV